MDSRYGIFTLWTDPVHQAIAQEVYEKYIANRDTNHFSQDKLRIYKYVLKTQYLCGLCRKLMWVQSDIISIARNPTVLFEGDILVCVACMAQVHTKTNFRCYLRIKCKIDDDWDSWYPGMLYVYNVCYDYYTILWDVVSRRQSYRDPKDITLFDILSKNL